MSVLYPSIWLADLKNKHEFDLTLADNSEAVSVIDWIDDRLLTSRHAFSFPAYCVVCKKVTPLQYDWRYSGSDPTSSSINPAWTETGFCPNCKLNSRMRALVDFLEFKGLLNEKNKIFIAEATTPMYRIFKKKFKTIVGSEFLGSDIKSGSKVFHKESRKRIQHEDLTNLSFKDLSFDLILTLDIFEHIPNYKHSFVEIFRVLKESGTLVFTIPFFYNIQDTVIRASIDNDGSIIHHLPPEIHGNPLSKSGSLCYQNFGWDILQSLTSAGFNDATAFLYWGPWKGHLGFPFFIFKAQK